MTSVDDFARLESLEASRAAAIVAGDVAALEGLTDSDYVHVEASGRLRDRDTFIDGLAPEGGRFERYVLMDNRIRIFGDAAVVTGTFQNCFVSAGGQVVARYARHTRVYIRRSNGWMNVSHQATLLAESD